MQILQFIRKCLCLCAHMHTCMTLSMLVHNGAFRKRPLAAQTRNVLPATL